MTQPRLSIVLIHSRMRDHLRGCLASIARQAAPWPVETIVVHLPDESDDGQWIAREFPWGRLVFAERFGIAHMRNIGLREAGDSDYVLILDVDARLIIGSLEALANFMDQRPKAAVCAAKTIRPDGPLEHNAKRFYDWTTIAARRSPLNRMWPRNPWTRRHLMLDQDHDQPFECDWVAGACMMLRGTALREIGAFDERFIFGFEDVDWCFRAKQAGWRVLYCPDAVIVHHVQRRSARGFNRMTFEHLRSLWRFRRKHGRLN